MKTSDQRYAERVKIGEVGLEAAGVCSVGRIFDISATGIRIEQGVFMPDIDSEVRVTFVLSLDQPGFEVLGRVTRHTESGGFALEFEAVEARLRDMLERLTARMRELPDLPPSTAHVRAGS